MARYIDADKLSLELAEELEKNQIPRRNAKSNIPYLLNLDKINYARFLLSVADTEDVVPVIHAHWIEEEDLNCNPIIRCSACKDVWHIESDSGAFGDHFYFCPNCGAKMDEAVE